MSFRALSEDWEQQTGYDSIPTIERVYERTPAGAFCCPWPRCGVVRRDSVAMWRHVHTGHGNNTLPPEAQVPPDLDTPALPSRP